MKKATVTRATRQLINLDGQKKTRLSYNIVLSSVIFQKYSVVTETAKQIMESSTDLFKSLAIDTAIHYLLIDPRCPAAFMNHSTDRSNVIFREATGMAYDHLCELNEQFRYISCFTQRQVAVGEHLLFTYSDGFLGF